MTRTLALADLALAPAVAAGVENLLVLGVYVVVIAVAVVLSFLKVEALYGGSSTDEERTNCPTCGARVAADAAVCEYCGDSLDGSY